MILNRQSKAKVDLRAAADLARRLGKILGIEGRGFNVCFVDDDQIRTLNAAHRNKAKATDVLSFPWKPGSPLDEEMQGAGNDPDGEFKGFLGDVVISVETAGRNAEAEGHTPTTEISWLILHGVLHLIGMDHETDGGEMAALEHGLRSRLGIDSSAGFPAARSKTTPSRPSGRSPKSAPRTPGC